MIKFLYHFSLILFNIPFLLYGQDFIPYNVTSAIETGTRTTFGIPGEKYFQNSASYTIDAGFNPRSGELEGKADIVYFNNSTDSLRFLTLRLYQNIYKKGALRDDAVDPAVISEGMKITALHINGEDLTRKLSSRAKTDDTNYTIFLHSSVNPGDSCLLHIEW